MSNQEMPGHAQQREPADDRDALVQGELTAALLSSAATGMDTIPTGLAERIIAAGEVAVRVPNPPVLLEARPSVPPPNPNSAAPRRGRLGAALRWSGWLVAAAMLALVVRSGRATPNAGDRAPKMADALVTSPSQQAAALRDSLMTADSALVRLAWAPSSDETARDAGGDVVWSARAQRGVMRFTGLKPNAGRRWQYQLWIFDKRRDRRYPVDGGVFDVPVGSTELFVPVTARLTVGEAVMFAVTVEAPGGVVVSGRERVAMIADRGTE